MKTIIQGENPNTVVFSLSNNRFKLDFSTIICGGSEITQYFMIPYNHEIEKMEIKHTDSSDIDSNEELAYSLEHKHHGLWILMHTITISLASDIADEFSNFNMLSGQYRLITNSTNTTKLYISLIIKVIE